MIEVEVKVQISDPVLMRNQFEENQGVYKFSMIHEDTYYNMPKGLRDFKQTDEALRLRKSSRFDKRNHEKIHDLEYNITYKGKKFDTITKTREEIDIRIEDIKKMKILLDSLGFQEVFTVKKERELYEFKFKNSQIGALIDYLPSLNQHFIEVECLTESKEKLDESRELLFNFLSLFGIQKEDSITQSYLELILEHFELT
jgi:adenylate cyclase class 2